MKTGIAVVLTAALAAVAAGTAFGQSVEAEVAQAKGALSDAQARKLHLICPRGFEKASKGLADAEKALKAGGSIDRIQRHLAEADEALGACRQVEELGMVLARDALAARGEALAANAPEFAPDQWEKAEKSMTSLGRQIEGGAGEKARRDAEATAQLYADAELKAIRVDLLGKAKQAREQALAARADRWAPVTLAKAADLLGEAEDILQGDRSRQGEAAAKAAVAEDEYRHAAWIAGRAAAIDKDRDEFERVVLSYEQRMSALAGQLGFTADFSEGGAPVIENMSAAVTGLNDNIRDLQAKVDELQAVAAKYEQVAPLEEVNRKVTKVAGLFGPDEAEVSQSGDRLVVRLTALSFPTGSSEIQPKDFPVLTRVQAALREFPSSRVVIEGNTDSTGNPDFNQALSQRRAEAVREYLLANMSRDPASIATVGYGSSRPLASNETPEGRAKNRRIDVVIDLGSS